MLDVAILAARTSALVDPANDLVTGLPDRIRRPKTEKLAGRRVPRGYHPVRVEGERGIRRSAYKLFDLN